MLQMVSLWHQSGQASGTACPQIRAITKSVFLGLSEEERGGLLEDFLIVKDPNVGPEFYPQYVKVISTSHSRSLTSAFTDQFHNTLRTQNPLPPQPGTNSVPLLTIVMDNMPDAAV